MQTHTENTIRDIQMPADSPAANWRVSLSVVDGTYTVILHTDQLGDRLVYCGTSAYDAGFAYEFITINDIYSTAWNEVVDA